MYEKGRRVTTTRLSRPLLTGNQVLVERAYDTRVVKVKNAIAGRSLGSLMLLMNRYMYKE